MLRYGPTISKALVLLNFEMPSIRISLELAKRLYDGWKLRPVRHPVLAFALDKTTPSVIENILLRTVEVLEILQRTRTVLQLTPVFSKAKGRDRQPIDPTLRLAVELRHERVAHRVKIGMAKQPAWTHVQKEYGTVWPFISAVLDRIQALLDEVRGTGCLNHVVPAPGAARKEYTLFTEADVHELLDISETLSSALRQGGLTSA